MNIALRVKIHFKHVFLLNVYEMNIALQVKIHFKHVFLLNVYEMNIALYELKFTLNMFFFIKRLRNEHSFTSYNSL